MTGSQYSLGDLTIDPGARLVLRNGEAVAVSGMTFDFLAALVKAAPKLATFDHLADEVWNGRSVSPETIAQRASMLRRALSDGDNSREYFEAVRGVGFRLTAKAGPVIAAAPTSASASIAVLPFRDFSDGEDQGHFADGLVEDIIVGLSQIPQLLVISRNSTFSFKGREATTAEIASRLGVRYVLFGSVRRDGDRVRVAAQLVDAARDQNVWSKKYDRDITGVFSVQDEVTEAIVAALDFKIVSGEQGRHRRSKVRDPEAAEILYRGMYEYYKFEKSAGLAARAHFEDFVRRQPSSVIGYVWLAMAWTFSMNCGWESPQTALPKVRAYADKALEIDRDDPHALIQDAMCKVLAGSLDEALASGARAVQVSPNFDHGWFALGWAQMLSGDPNAAIDSQKQAMRLCPIMNALQFGVLATAYRNVGRYDEAIETFSECLRQFPDFVYAEVGRAVVYGMKGDQGAAKRAVNAALKLDPHYTVARFTRPNLYRDKSVMENVAKVLRAAGMPD